MGERDVPPRSAMAMAVAKAGTMATRCSAKAGIRTRYGAGRNASMRKRTQTRVGRRGSNRRGGMCRATEEEGARTDAPAKDSSAGAETAQEKEQKPGLKEGQGTAIVTGAVSLLLGVAYLALTLWLDQRGAQLQPPPPEAYLP